MEVSRFDLSELVASTSEQMSLLAEEKHIAVQATTVERVEVMGDRFRLKQVVVNLLDNAIKYSREDAARSPSRPGPPTNRPSWKWPTVARVSRRGPWRGCSTDFSGPTACGRTPKTARAWDCRLCARSVTRMEERWRRKTGRAEVAGSSCGCPWRLEDPPQGWYEPRGPIYRSRRDDPAGEEYLISVSGILHFRLLGCGVPMTATTDFPPAQVPWQRRSILMIIAAAAIPLACVPMQGCYTPATRARSHAAALDSLAPTDRQRVMHKEWSKRVSARML